MRLALCNVLLALTFAGVSSTGLADENGGGWHNVNGEEVFVYGRGGSDTTHESQSTQASESQQRMEQHNQDISAIRENEQRILDLEQRINGDSGTPNSPSPAQQIVPRPAQVQRQNAGAAQQQAAWAAQRRAAQQQQSPQQQATLPVAKGLTPQQAALAGVLRQLQQQASNASAQRHQQQRAEWEAAQHRRRIENAQRIVRQGPPEDPEPYDMDEDGDVFPVKPPKGWRYGRAVNAAQIITDNMHRDTPDPKIMQYHRDQSDYAAARRDVHAAAEMKRRGIQYVPIQSPTIPRQGQANQQNGPSLQRPLPSFGKWRR